VAQAYLENQSLGILENHPVVLEEPKWHRTLELHAVHQRVLLRLAIEVA